MKEVRGKAKGVIIRKVRREIWLFCLIMSASVLGLLATADAVGQTCIEPPRGLVSWWPGDGDATDLVDGNSGTRLGAFFTPAKVGEGFTFDSDHHKLNFKEEEICRNHL